MSVMDPNCWATIESLHHATLPKELNERPQYLARVCGQDPELRREVNPVLGCADADLG